jgi:hypothetical protein
VELGPGDSIASAIIGAAFSVRRTYLIDVGNFASNDVSFYVTGRRPENESLMPQTCLTQPPR